GRRAWDGGFFGVVSWAALMLAGSLVYDLIQLGSINEAFRRLMLLGAILMLLGYFLSCLTRLYDKIPENHSPIDKNARPFSSTPIIPDWDNARGRPLGSLLAEPPFVSPPSKEFREWNYWM